ncbi:MAG: YedE family putative selenium transporter [Planctomycetota bacterium]|nr:YedE family putative selenium transporter [Planctomycetota bacterium]
MLRGEHDAGRTRNGLIAMLLIGLGCGSLVYLGNPGNMGICGACFLRDSAGALRLFGDPQGLHYLRPEVIGVVFGALLWMLLRGQWQARSGSHAATRFFFGIWMGIGSLVFLGCPFRMLQRLGGLDGTAWIALPGFIAGVGLGLFFEKRGYNVGKTQGSPAVVGLLMPALLGIGAVMWYLGKLDGPGPDGPVPPAHAPWLISLGVALVAGAILSMTRFCAVTAARQVYQKDRRMILAALAMMIGYGLVVVTTGKSTPGIEGQPAAHTDHLWSALSLALVGLCGCLAGGCPVRQLVMTGEGNGDAAMTVVGILLGGALSHGFGLASSGAGTTAAGQSAIVVGIVIAILYGAMRSVLVSEGTSAS